jgi:hypothetical protein
MANIFEIKQQLKAYLTSNFGVTKWDAIQFSLLPKSDPVGYFQAIEVRPTRATVISVWLVGIGVASTTLDDLDTKVAELVSSIIDTFGQNPVCISGLGSMKLSEQVQIEVPNTYAQQSQVSTSTGFSTSVSFGLEITTAN